MFGCWPAWMPVEEVAWDCIYVYPSHRFTHSSTFVIDICPDKFCRRQMFFLVTSHSIKTRWAGARARRVGVADLYNVCSDWSTVKECRHTQFDKMSAAFCRWHLVELCMTTFFDGDADVFVSAANVSKCEPPVSYSIVHRYCRKWRIVWCTNKKLATMQGVGVNSNFDEAINYTSVTSDDLSSRPKPYRSRRENEYRFN